jgi:heptosyltransferase-2/heptosyltransferase-3
VVLRPDHLGDVLLSRPAIERLRVALPGAALTVVAGPWGAPSLQGVDARVVSFSFPGFTRRAKRSPWAPYLALLALAVRLRHERFDAALIFRRDHWWGALAIAVAGIPLRVGVATPKAAPFLTHSVPALEVESWGATSCRVADALLGAIGVPAPDRPFEPTFMPTLSAAREVGIWLDEHDLAGRPFVAVHPDAGAALKSWPAARWSALVDELPADVAVVLTGTPAEAAELASIANRAQRPLAMAVDLDWDGLAALYRRAALVVGMDSGPLHLATAVGTPTVRVYGPTDRRVFGPAGSVDRHRTIASTLICAPCGSLDGAPCGYLRHPPCLANVDVHDVAIAACAVLEAGALT